MKTLKNWDNKTWLSSDKYIFAFHNFLKTKVRFNKNLKILDIGCGRANIISFLQKKYRFKNKAIGIDIIKNKNIKRNIIFKRLDAIKFLKKKKKFDLIIIKQSIHFFSKNNLPTLLDLTKNSLNPSGKLIILSLKTKNNKIPCFKKMREKLNKSLKKDDFLLRTIKKKLKKTRETNFNFKVFIAKKKYIEMIKNRYISCLLNLSKKDLIQGIGEIDLKYNNKIQFTDTLKSIIYKR